jgi:hypothetical protein
MVGSCSSLSLTGGTVSAFRSNERSAAEAEAEDSDINNPRMK